jgi:hypothetical protein
MKSYISWFSFHVGGSSSGKGDIHGPDLHETIPTNYSFAQQVELPVLIFYCKKL